MVKNRALIIPNFYLLWYFRNFLLQSFQAFDTGIFPFNHFALIVINFFKFCLPILVTFLDAFMKFNLINLSWHYQNILGCTCSRLYSKFWTISNELFTNLSDLLWRSLVDFSMDLLKTNYKQSLTWWFCL